jgi:hypothetical protein
VPGHIEGNRALVRARLEAVLDGLQAGPRKVIELAPIVHGGELRSTNAQWWLTETLCYLTHLERSGRVAQTDDDRWARV